MVSIILSLWIKELIDEAYDEAYKEAVVQGEREIVKRMLKRGHTIQEIAEDTGLSEEEVRKLAEEP